MATLRTQLKEELIRKEVIQFTYDIGHGRLTKKAIAQDLACLFDEALRQASPDQLQQALDKARKRKAEKKQRVQERKAQDKRMKLYAEQEEAERQKLTQEGTALLSKLLQEKKENRHQLLCTFPLKYVARRVWAGGDPDWSKGCYHYYGTLPLPCWLSQVDGAAQFVAKVVGNHRFHVAQGQVWSQADVNKTQEHVLTDGQELPVRVSTRVVSVTRGPKEQNERLAVAELDLGCHWDMTIEAFLPIHQDMHRHEDDYAWSACHLSLRIHSFQFKNPSETGPLSMAAEPQKKRVLVIRVTEEEYEEVSNYLLPMERFDAEELQYMKKHPVLSKAREDDKIGVKLIRDMPDKLSSDEAEPSDSAADVSQADLYCVFHDVEPAAVSAPAPAPGQKKRKQQEPDASPK